MLSFENDYNVGAHPQVLKALMDTNLIRQPGYGNDDFCRSAAEKIRAACACPEAEVFFISGGTQTNQVVISSLLRSYEGVLSAVTGHVNGHEAGAIEYSGHKVLTLPQHEGKIDWLELEAWIKSFYADESHEHMVFPGMVYISHPTEYGTVYSKAELERLSQVCRRYDLPLTKYRMAQGDTYDALLNDLVNGEAMKAKRLHAGDSRYTVESGNLWLELSGASGAWGDYDWFDQNYNGAYAMSLELRFACSENDHQSYDWIEINVRPGMVNTVACLKELGLITDRDLVTREEMDKMENYLKFGEAYETDAAGASIGIIGGADGPTTVFVTGVTA